jgi:hypothetical protein
MEACMLSWLREVLEYPKHPPLCIRPWAWMNFMIFVKARPAQMIFTSPLVIILGEPWASPKDANYRKRFYMYIIRGKPLVYTRDKRFYIYCIAGNIRGVQFSRIAACPRKLDPTIGMHDIALNPQASVQCNKCRTSHPSRLWYNYLIHIYISLKGWSRDGSMKLTECWHAGN